MTDTGQVPGEGQPEHAGTVEQPGTPAPDAYTYLDPSAAATEDDDLLLMPGAQGAWTEPQPGVAPAPPVTVPLPQTPPGEQTPYEHTAQRPTAPGPATDGHGTAHTPQQPHPAQPPQQAPRRPLHMGPPMPDTGGVVRSLADRGPAPVAPAAPAPAPAPAPMPAPSAPAPGPERQAAAVPATPEAQPWVPGPAETAAPDATATGQYAPAEGAAAPAPQLAPPAPTVPAPRHAAPAQQPAPEAPAAGVPAQHAPVPPQAAEQAPAQEPAPAQPAASAPADAQPVDAQPVEAPAAEAAEAQAVEPSQPVEATTVAQPDTQPDPGAQAAQTAPAQAEATPEAPAEPAQTQSAEPEPTEPLEAAPAADTPAEAASAGPAPAEAATPGSAPTEATAPETVAPEPQPEPAAAQTEPSAAPAPEPAPQADPAPEPAAQADPAPADEAPAAAPTEPNAPEAPEAPSAADAAPADPAAVAAPADEAPTQAEPVAEAEPVEPTAVPAPAEGAPEAAQEAHAPAEAPSQEAPAAAAAPEVAPVADPVAETAPTAELPAEPQAEAVPAPVATAEGEEAPATAAEAPAVAETPSAAVATPVEPPATEQAPAQPPATEQAPAQPPATEQAPAQPPATEQAAPEAPAEPAAEAPLEPQPPAAVAAAAPAPAPDSTVEPPAPAAPNEATAPETAAPATAPATAPDEQPADTAPEAAQAPEAAPEAAPAPAAEAAPAPTPEAAPGPETPGPEAAPVASPAPSGPPAPGYADDEREAILRVMRERRDIRNGFRSDPIPHEVLLRVLEAAHTAPSVGHSQPWDFVVIRSAETRRAMHELAQRQREAYAKSLPKGRAKQFKELKIEAILDTPVNIVVTADPTRGGRHTLGRHTQPQMAPYSSALAVENLWLAARAEGLGVGWVSFFDEREMVRALGLPEHLEVVAYLCVGYVDEFPEEPELMQAGWSRRRPLSWVVHEETYGRRALPGEEPHDLLQETVAGIRPLDAKALGEAWERQKRMTKPSGALGMLEIISAQLCGLSRTCPPPIPEPAAVAIFAGDHGVHAQGVTAWPQEVTAQMVANFLGGGAVCNAFANQVGAEVCVVDVGVAAELPATPGLLPRKVRAGTADFTTGPALTRDEVLAAIEVGVETARDLVAAGNKAILTGEMGIANTTASAALISVYTGADPAEVTGRGTGINDEMHARKVDVVRRALELHQPDPADPIGVLGAVGGLEHAAMVGFILGGASLRTPVILDGVSAGAAALVARAVAPESLAACIAGHRSAEPGHMAALNKLGLRPLVDLDLRLGEGTGALLALPLVQSAARAMHEVATFDSAGVTEK
ncbi:nicotinate-nucleotide--dimethylbenzimidazole phosphoribosyltransferase [Streptomyces fradiae]|uniref:nicotinate-nucleotide--dimethylbenzimidazole phosphoribosyltransferase n=1 Tax=Streptomyces fradiae TaxID=1906 RepID=UPI003985F4B2